MARLDDLPVELIYAIHLESASSSLPLVSKSFQSLLAEATDSHKAQYLLLKSTKKRVLSRAARYPICSLSVLRLLEKSISRADDRIDELPRRLVKGLSNASCRVDLTYIEYLLRKHKASADSSNGYFLARAVFANHLPLVDLLLSYGASPAMNDGWAVRNAISSGDLGMVKRLLEVPSDRPDEPVPLSEEDSPGHRKKKRRKSDSSDTPRKRRKVATSSLRCVPTTKMLETAVQAKQWAIVDYLTSKGASPSIEVLKLFK